MKQLNLREITPEMKKKALAMKSKEELIAYAKENGYELSDEKAARILEQFSSDTDLPDSVMETVAGGVGSDEGWMNSSEGSWC